MYDVVVVGGSIAGLTTARTVAKHGFDTLVLEEDLEIGTPEHCGGMVSLNALLELGVMPSNKMILSNIDKARIYSPSRRMFEIKASNVLAIDRRLLDKTIAKQAIKNDARIELNTPMLDYAIKDDHISIKTSKDIVKAKILVDARGCKVAMLHNKDGAIPSIQYELSADWIDYAVEVHFNNELYPAFFAWLIPNGNNIARVGVAGRNINIAKALEAFLDGRKGSFLKQVYAPIWIKGAFKRFVHGRVVRVGDAAGQTKPTTAGGIYSCGIAGVYAGDAIADALEYDDLSLLRRYEQRWFGKFGKEFERMLLARKVFERLDNKAIDEIFDNLDKSMLDEIAKSDFDFHSDALIRMLSVSKVFAIAKSILGNEVRKLFNV